LFVKIFHDYYRLLIQDRFTRRQLIFLVTILCSILLRVLIGTVIFGDFLDTNWFLDFLLGIPCESFSSVLAESNPFEGGGVLFSPFEPYKSLSASLARFSSHTTDFITQPATQRLFYELCTMGRLNVLAEQFRNPVNTPVVRLLNSPSTGRPRVKLEAFQYFKNTPLYKEPLNPQYIAVADEKTLSTGIYVRLHEAAVTLDAKLHENEKPIGSGYEVIPRKEEWDNWFLRKENFNYYTNLVTVPHLVLWNHMHGLGSYFNFSRCLNEFDGINHLIVSYSSSCVDPVADPTGNRVADVFITGKQQILIELKSVSQFYQHDVIVLSKEDLRFISKNKNLTGLHSVDLLTKNKFLFKYIKECYTKTGYLADEKIQKVLTIWNYDSDFQKAVKKLPSTQVSLDLNSKKKFQLEFKGQADKAADFKVPFNSTMIPEFAFGFDEWKYQQKRRLEQQHKFAQYNNINIKKKMYNNHINFVETKLTEWYNNPLLLSKLEKEEEYFLFEFSYPSIFKKNVKLSWDICHWYMNMITPGSLSAAVRKTLLNNLLLFTTCYMFDCPYFMITFDGTFYSKFKLFFETTFSRLHKQYVNVTGCKGLIINDKFEYLIVFERLAYVLRIKVYVTQYAAWSFHEIPTKVWQNFLLEGCFLNVSEEEKEKRCFVLKCVILQNRYCLFNLDDYCLRFRVDDISFAQWEWKYVTDAPFSLFWKKQDFYNPEEHEEEYGSKEIYDLKMKEERFAFQTHLSYIPPELCGLSDDIEDSFNFSTNNKMLLRREFLQFQHTDYFFEDETLQSIQSMYKALGIKKRFDGSHLFQKNLQNIPDYFLESTSVELRGYDYDKPVSIPRFGSFSVNYKNHYQTEIEILQYEILQYCSGAPCFSKDFILEWLAFENMYGDFTCHFLYDYNMTKAAQLWFYKDIRTSYLPEPIPLNIDFTFNREEIQEFVKEYELCNSRCMEVQTEIDPYRDWIKYNKNEIYYYERKKPPRPFTEIQQAFENLVNQPRDPKIKQLFLEFSNQKDEKENELFKWMFK
jgi:hypothetical protein